MFIIALTACMDSGLLERMKNLETAKKFKLIYHDNATSVISSGIPWNQGSQLLRNWQQVRLNQYSPLLSFRDPLKTLI